MNMKDFMLGKKPVTSADRNMLYLAKSFSGLYYAGLKAHKLSYSAGLNRVKKLGCPVICVGNITLGGSGKTPVVEKIVSEFTALNLKCAVISRGYKSKNSNEKITVVSDGKKLNQDISVTGDEPAMIARNCPGAAVVCCSDRYAAGKLAIEKFKSQIIVMDDGMQHWGLKKDFIIVCISAKVDFANSLLVPAGIRREPFSAIKRADAVVITNLESAESGNSLLQFIKSIAPEKPVLLSSHSIKTFNSMSRLKMSEFPDDVIKIDNLLLKGKKAFAFSGLANNSSFHESLTRIGINLSGFIGFDDHYAYSDEDIKSVIKQASSAGADMIVTTQKDAVKLAGFDEIKSASIPVYYSKLEIDFFQINAMFILIERMKQKISDLEKLL